ncbi:MAG: IPT/TIG domain-containing protein [Candidatus Dormibacteria bacterium]
MPAPEIRSVDPTSITDRGGTVGIRGYGFSGVSAVTVDDVATSSFAVQGDGSIRITSPPHARGVAEVAVVTPSGTSASIPMNPAAMLTYDGCDDQPTAGTISYPGGRYSLVGLPGGTTVHSDGFNYGWFDLGGGNSYTPQVPTAPLATGHGYWAWFACPRLVAPSAGSDHASFPLGAYHASMIGNPSGTSPATATGHDFAARWDPDLNGGAGGYHISRYQEPQRLAVGEGMWVFTYHDTNLRVTAG